MKKTVVLLLALAGMAQAATNIEANALKPLTNGLVALWTFDDNSTDYLTTTGVSASIAPTLAGNSELRTTGGVDGAGYLHSDAASRIEMYNNLSSFNISANDFTIGLKIKNVSSDYHTVFSFGLGNSIVYMQTTNPSQGDKIALYGSSLVTGNNTKNLIRGNTWGNVIITGSNGTLTLYVNDSVVATTTYTASEGTKLSNFQLGAKWAGGDNGPADADFDDVALWNRVLSDTEIGKLKGGATVMSYTIPEPATATLSLLALAGLAVRRRRK